MEFMISDTMPCSETAGVLSKLSAENSFRASKVEERISMLFDLYNLPDDDKKEFGEKLDLLVDEFLSRQHVSTSIELDKLCSLFLENEIPAKGCTPNSYLEMLNDAVLPFAVHTGHPRCVGQMTSILPFFSKSLSKLISVINQNVVRLETSKSLHYLERQTLAMIHKLIYHFDENFYMRHAHDRDSTLGVLTTGGSLGNTTALWCARNRRLGPIEDFAGVEMEGMERALAYYGYKSAAIIGPKTMHYSIVKSTELLGIGTHGALTVSPNRQFIMDINELKRIIDDCEKNRQLIIAIVAVAGSTDAGSIDPLKSIGDLAHDHGIHFHVDAAWGGPLLFSKKHRQLLNGIAEADTVTIDGHKMLHLPIGYGILCMRDAMLAKSIEKHANYIIRPNSDDLGRKSLEGSRPAQALMIHASLCILGAEGYGYLAEHSIKTASLMASLISNNDEFQLLVVPQTNIVLYRYLPKCYRDRDPQTLNINENYTINQANICLQSRQWEQGRSFVSRTMFNLTFNNELMQVVALRAVIANPLTDKNDLQAILDDQIITAKEVGLDLAGQVDYNHECKYCMQK